MLLAFGLSLLSILQQTLSVIFLSCPYTWAAVFVHLFLRASHNRLSEILLSEINNEMAGSPVLYMRSDWTNESTLSRG